MLGILYLCLCFFVGYVISSYAFPKLGNVLKTTYRGAEIQINKALLFVPVWFLTGTLCLTWLTYIIGYIMRAKKEPLLYANIIVMVLAFIVTVFGIIHLKRSKKQESIASDDKKLSLDLLFMFLSGVLATVLMWRTFYVTGDTLKVGLSVFSDFSPHLLMIRSFSFGNNFPTTYGHFAGQDIRYHFMFQFLAGNLEYLGLRIDYAFNIPSIISLLSTFSLLYVLAVKITGSKAAAWIAGLFFAFRSSPSLFKYLSDIPNGSIIKTLNENIEFIGETVNENWGLWNLNVYVNQRHLAFSLAVMLFAIIMFLPLIYSQAERITGFIYENKKSGIKGILLFPEFIKYSFLKKEAWLIQDIGKSVVFGIILGSTAFFNGAVLICALIILFFMAVFSDRRIEFLITAVIATVLSFIQSVFFIKGTAVSPKYFFGFIAPNKTFFGVIKYIIDLTGIFFIVLFAAFILFKAVEKYIMFIFLTPFISAFTLSLTPDITVNHKNIMLSIMLMGIFNAWFIRWLFAKKGAAAKIGACILIFILTATGIYDFTVILNRNADSRNLSYNLNDEITLWVKDNASSQDIFLTHNYYLHSLVLGGAMLYDGWQYFTWSAGYDTAYRDQKVREIYSAENVYELGSLVKENNIRFIVIDYNNRNANDYILNEELINDTYDKVFESGVGEDSFVIYDTKIQKN